MRLWLDCLPIPRSCCVHLPILTASRRKAYSAEQGPLWTMKGLLPPSTDQPQKKCLCPSPQRTRCIVLTALGPTIWLSTASLNDQDSNPPMLQMPDRGPCCIKMSGKWRQGQDVSPTLAPGKMKTNLPVMRVCINGVMCDALIDSGCTHCLVRSSVCGPPSGHMTEVLTIDGKSMTSKGVTSVNLQVDERTPIVVDMLAVDGDLLGFDFLLGRVNINEHGEANFPNEVFSAGAADTVKIEWPDFDDAFDLTEKKQTTTWKWLGKQPPKQVINQTREYTMPKHVRKDYDCELQSWINNGWLKPYPEKELGPPRGLILLMAIVQHNKGKVQPVMDYRELNNHMEAHTVRADVCSQKLRDWHRKGSDVSVLDLRKPTFRSMCTILYGRSKPWWWKGKDTAWLGWDLGLT